MSNPNGFPPRKKKPSSETNGQVEANGQAQDTPADANGSAANGHAPDLIPPTDPLSQQPGESARAHAAFLDYCDMGPGRTLRLLHEHYTHRQRSTESATTQREPPTLEVNTLFRWSLDHGWQRRVKAYDAQELVRRAAERDRIRRERQEQVEREEWERGQKINRLADEVLSQAGKFLTTKRQAIPGRQDAAGNWVEPPKEIITIGIKAAEALRAVEIGSKLSRMASGLPTDAMKHEHDYSKLSDAQLLALLARMSQDAETRRGEEADPALIAVDPDELDD